MNEKSTRKDPYRDNAALCAPVSIDCSAPTSTRNHQIATVIQTICPKELDMLHHDFESDFATRRLSIKQLGGGLSNFLFVVSSLFNGRSVLIRVHVGEDDDRFVDRGRENEILAWLSRVGVAPIYYGRFENGRVEEFYKGSEPLSCLDMPRYAEPIAKAMAALHSLQMPDVDESSKTAEIWDTVDTWFEIARDATFTDQKKTQIFRSLDVSGTLLKEWKWLRQQLASPLPQNDPIPSLALSFSRETVFAHMDCQSLNILRNGESIRLIDFEYAAHNPRAVDLANTFCEFCDMNNLCPDYETQYPSPAVQDVFLERYVRKAHPGLAVSLDQNRGWSVFLDVLKEDIGRHTLVSHMSWGIWGVAQAYISPIEFDYLQYSSLRMQGYWYFKNKYWNESCKS